MKWFQQVRKLSNVRRCGVMRTIINQNVAEHSYYAAILAIKFLEDLEQKGMKLDRGPILEKVLLHDVEEAVTGDIPYPFKRASKALGYLIEEVKNNLMPSIFPAWVVKANRDAKETYGGAIVKAVDYVELYAYCLEEMHMGNQDPYLKEITTECKRILNEQANSEFQLEHTVGNLAFEYMREISEIYTGEVEGLPML